MPVAHCYNCLYFVCRGKKKYKKFMFSECYNFLQWYDRDGFSRDYSEFARQQRIKEIRSLNFLTIHKYLPMDHIYYR